MAGTVAGKSVLSPVKGKDGTGGFTGFTVSASKPKATAAPAAGVLHRKDGGSEQLFKISLPAGSGAISEVKLSGADGPKMYFDCKDLGSGYVVIHFREPFRPKPDAAEIEPTTVAKATTTLTLQVFIKGGSTIKPATTVKVKVAAR